MFSLLIYLFTLFSPPLLGVHSLELPQKKKSLHKKNRNSGKNAEDKKIYSYCSWGQDIENHSFP